MRFRARPAGRWGTWNQNAGSPGEARSRRTGDIFRELASWNPAREATGKRDQSAGYARRSRSCAIMDAGSIPAVSTSRVLRTVLRIGTSFEVSIPRAFRGTLCASPRRSGPCKQRTCATKALQQAASSQEYPLRGARLAEGRRCLPGAGTVKSDSPLDS